jgi:hypothetical protein
MRSRIVFFAEDDPPRCCSLGLLGFLAITVLMCVAPLSAQTALGAAQRVGAIDGQVTDQLGVAVARARITLAREDGTVESETDVRDDGRFSFADVGAGPFRLTVTAADFAPYTVLGHIALGEALALPPFRLTLSVGTVAVDVRPTRVEIADRQIMEQEQQRLLGIFPNFTVSYDPNAVPLNARQKFQLTWKSVVDPMQFVSVAVFAGVQQARNDFSGFGGGPEGYAKRYAALYATSLTGSVITRFVMPVVFGQDPRYFYRGTGSRSSRVAYAISRAVVRKGDDGRWQPDYSRICGHLATGALSNLYYPEENRRGVGLTLGNAAFGIGGAAVNNLMQEFVLKRFTTRTRKTQ